MTLPYEEYNSINSARRFLYDLLDTRKTPKVPRSIRLEARRILKHFPTCFSANEKYAEDLKKWGIEPQKQDINSIQEDI
jgi:hypothetical protein